MKKFVMLSALSLGLVVSFAQAQQRGVVCKDMSTRVEPSIERGRTCVEGFEMCYRNGGGLIRCSDWLNNCIDQNPNQNQN